MNRIKLLAIALVSISLGTSGYAQIGGMEKLKNKTKSKVEKPTSKKKKMESTSSDTESTTTSSSSSKTTEETPKVQTEEEKRKEAYQNSPARGSIWSVTNYLDGIEEKPGHHDSEGNLVKAEIKLVDVKEKDPNYPYISELESQLAKCKELLQTTNEVKNERRKYEQQLDTWQKELWNLKDEPWKYDEVLVNLTDEKLDALITEIENSGINENSLKEKVEKLRSYKEEVMTGKVKEAVIKDNEEAYRRAVRWTAEYRKDPDFLKYLEFNAKVDPEIEGLEKQISWTKELQSRGIQDQALTEYIPRATARLKEIKEYRDSGELEKVQEQLRYEALDRVRVGENARTESAVSEMVKKDWDKERFGTILRIVTVGDWSVEKNGLDIPTHKRKTVHVVYKDKNGSCFLYETEVQRDYEGGGSYGKTYLDDAYGMVEMLCENAMK